MTASIALTFTLGCALRQNVPRSYLFYGKPPTAQVRTAAGQVQILPVGTGTVFQADRPQSRGQATAGGFLSGLTYLPREIRDNPHGDANPGMIVAIPVWMASQAILTAIASGVQGVSPRTASHQQSILRRAVEELRPAEMLVAAMSATGLAAAPSGPSKQQGDSVVQVRLTDVSLVATSDAVNPQLGLTFGIQVRWLRADDGTELYRNEFTYRGIRRHKLSAWSQNEGRRFRQELQRLFSWIGPRMAKILWEEESGWANQYCLEVPE